MGEFIRAIEDDAAEMLLRGPTLARALALAMICVTAGAAASLLTLALWIAGIMEHGAVYKACGAGLGFALLGVALNWLRGATR